MDDIIETLDEATATLSKALMILNDKTEILTAKKIKELVDDAQAQLLHLLCEIEDHAEEKQDSSELWRAAARAICE